MDRITLAGSSNGSSSVGSGLSNLASYCPFTLQASLVGFESSVPTGLYASAVMRFGRPVVATESLVAMRALADDLQRRRWALRRIGRHFRLGVGGCGARLIGLGNGGDVVDNAVLAAFLSGHDGWRLVRWQVK